jgi:hypothetical protein
MPRKPSEPLLRPCACHRDGYMMVICQEHAPIPFELTDRGRRDIRHMKQWDAIEPLLRESMSAQAKSHRQALTAGRRLIAASKRASKRSP